MHVAGVSHVPIQVRDMETSLTFYRDFLGMSVSLDLHEVHEAYDIDRRGVYLRWEDSPRAPFVVLGQPLNKETPGEAGKLFDVGIDHIGFFVDDVDAFIERAERLGIRRFGQPGPAGIQQPSAYGDAGPGHVKTAMFFDPDGVVVQLDEWVDGGASPT